MSKNARKKLTLLAVLFFVIAVPMVVSYASGYRISFGKDRGVVSTGGVFVSLSPSGSSFSVDGQVMQSTGFFSNSFFEQDLTPGLHSISVTKDGYTEWSKNIYIRPNEVSEINSFLIPDKINWNVISTATTSILASTSTLISTSTPIITVSNLELVRVKNLFVSTTSTSSSQYVLPVSTTTARVSAGINIWLESNVLVVERKSSNLLFPAVFCASGINNCLSRIYVPLSYTPSFVDFYPNRSDVVMVVNGRNVYAVELDSHEPRVVTSIYSGDKPNVRVSNGTIYVMDDSKVYTTESI